MTWRDYPSIPGGRVLCVIGLLLISSCYLTACEKELDPEDPGDAYLIFRTALFANDSETIWSRTDDETRDYFQENYERLLEMNALIERYLPQTDHELARQQSGVEILARVHSGETLFLEVFTPQNLPDNAAMHFGSTIQEIRMAEDGETAIILTRGAQEFVMTYQETEWYVNLVRSEDFLDASFQWIDRNEVALRQTVEDLIAQERRVREAIIAELMGLDVQ